MRRLAGLAAAVIAAMAIGQLITDKIPLGEGASAPFVHKAAVGDTVNLRYADVEVTGVRAAKKIDGSDTVLAGGTFLIVDLRMVGKLEGFIQGIYLLDRKERRYSPTTRGSNCTIGTNPPTGAPWYMMVCFDVPRSALEGVRLVVAKGDYGVNGSGLRRDDLAEIDLGIDKVEADRMWATKAAYKTYFPGFDPLPATHLKEAP